MEVEVRYYFCRSSGNIKRIADSDIIESAINKSLIINGLENVDRGNKAANNKDRLPRTLGT